MAYFCHEIRSNEKEKPVRGISVDEFHTHNVKKKKPYIKEHDSIYTKFKMYADII